MYFTADYRGWIDTGKTLYIHCRKITFSTVGIRLGQLFPNIVKTLVFYSQMPGVNSHWIDLVRPLLENYFFQSGKKVGPVVKPNIVKKVGILHSTTRAE